jgi:hypothetical protein
MTKEEVAKLLPEILPDVRAHVANANVQGHLGPSSNAEAGVSRN